MTPYARRLLPASRRRKLGWLAVLLLAAGAAGSFGWSRWQLAAAERALERHDLQDAQQHLTWSRRCWPWNARARFLAARAARRLDDHAAAERLLAEYEKRYGATPEWKLEWQLLGAQQGDLAEVESGLLVLVQNDHADAALISEALAKGYQKTFRWSAMRVRLDQLLEREPDHVPGLVLRGKAFTGLRQFEPARADFQRAVDLSGESDAARLGLAEALHRLGRNREAVYHYEVLRQRRPDDAAVLLGLARCRFDAAEPDAARHHLDALLERQPDHVAGLVERGRLALRQDLSADAERWLTRAVRQAPWHREALDLLAAALEVQGKADEAEACRRQRRELEDRDGRLGQLYLLLRQRPRDPQVRCEVAKWYADNGQEAEAVGWFFGALSVQPGHAASHRALADYFDRHDQPRRAAEHRLRAEEGPGEDRGGAVP